jgi:hypothetical protein
MVISKTRQYQSLLHSTQTAKTRLAGAERARWAPQSVERERASVAYWEGKLAAFVEANPRVIARHGGQYGNGVRNVPCAACGKLTHNRVDGCDGLELCRNCYAEISAENQHSDDGHLGHWSACAECQQMCRQLKNGK